MDFSDYGKENFNNPTLQYKFDNQRSFILKMSEFDNIKFNFHFDSKLREYDSEIEYLKRERDALKKLYDILYNIEIINKDFIERHNENTNKKFVLVSLSDYTINPTPTLDEIGIEIKEYSTQIMLYNTLKRIMFKVKEEKMK